LELFRPANCDAKPEPIALVSGLVRPKKGQLEFLRKVAPELAAAGIVSWIAGDFDTSEPYAAACAEAAAPLGNAVRFLGFRKDVGVLMRQASVVVVCSRYEGLVRSMIEAMSSGTPVVSFDISSARELLETQSVGGGTVVPVGQYEEMSNAIISFCKDVAHAKEAGRRGRAAALRLFDANVVVEHYERVYRQLGARAWDADEREA
jgi:glycosyltransferase involved in cell wall biosynthesis